MNAAQLGILVVGGLAGWWVVSYLFDRKKDGSAPTADPGSTGAATGTGGRGPDSGSAPGTDRSAGGAAMLAAAASVEHGDVSVFELGDRWPSIIGVARDASLEQIEAAYLARRTELGRRRYDATLGGDAREAVARELRTLDSAFEFVRAARGGRS